MHEEYYMPDFAKIFPLRALDVHKGSCGRVGVIAGSVSMAGAAVLTARAALRAGSGLVYLMTVKEAVPLINIQYPEIIVLPLISKKGFPGILSFKQIEQYVKQYRFNSLAIGPGLGQQEETKELISDVIRMCSLKKIKSVLDADCLNLLNVQDMGSEKEPLFVLTPHLKEFERVFGIKLTNNQECRVKKTREVALTCGQVILLKGHNTVVGFKDKIYINNTGNPGMATAGAGDVLTGIISSLTGQGVNLYDAAVLGAYLHGRSADYAYEKYGYGLIASDIINYLPGTLLDFH
ncbi:MAG: NAD(P)H-hydrate dehydratase [bacterium]|nr:NAD(P)H-hydrate dehydratase [bacterium]